MAATQYSYRNSGKTIAHFVRRQRMFSTFAFGKGERTEGIMKHIEKEIEEVRKKPNDIYEYIDIVILALDAAWRRGYSPEQIEQALFDKQEENMDRDWPPIDESKQDIPIEHIKEKNHDTTNPKTS